MEITEPPTVTLSQYRSALTALSVLAEERTGRGDFNSLFVAQTLRDGDALVAAIEAANPTCDLCGAVTNSHSYADDASGRVWCERFWCRQTGQAFEEFFEGEDECNAVVDEDPDSITRCGLPGEAHTSEGASEENRF